MEGLLTQISTSAIFSVVSSIEELYLWSISMLFTIEEWCAVPAEEVT